MVQKGDSTSKAPIEIFAGGGLGLLTGLLIGLSVSQVVGVVVGSLTALLVAFFGLKDRENKPSGADIQASGIAEHAQRETTQSISTSAETSPTYYSIRAGCFALFCVLGLVGGLYARTHNLLGVSLGYQQTAWKELGFSDEQVRQLIVFRELGIVPQGWAVATTETTQSKSGQTVFFADRSAACDRTRVERYGTASDAIKAWKDEALAWKNMAEMIENSVPLDRQKEVLQASWELTCK